MQNHKNQNVDYASRPPIVVVLGHVDHGKTTILDKVRQTKVAEKETGGITQHIGAYQVEHGGKKITFLDTPGHEAFSAIRSRGARVADLAVLVIAADEGVKPQTKEAIQIIEKEKIPLVVALNKTDKEGANPMRVKQELAENGIMAEGYGGTVPIVEISAKTGKGLDELLEMILLVAELEELKAPQAVPAKGVIIESHLDSRRGLVATLVVLEGELKVGDWVSAGTAFGHAKALEDFLGKPLQIAIASQPCLMLGWEFPPKVGQKFQAVASREEAESIASKETSLGPVNLFVKENSQESPAVGKKIANLIIKADVQSSLEAIDQVLRTIRSEEVDYKVIDYGVGNISDTDIKKATAAGALVIGFHVEIDDSARQMAEREKVKVQTPDIIYNLVEGVRSVMSDLLEPEIRRTLLAKVKILATFKTTDKSQIVGGKVLEGKVIRGAMIDVKRDGTLVITGRLGQLQHEKADVAEVAEGLEAGIRFDLPLASTVSLPVIKEGDVLEIYQEEKIKRTI